MNKDIPQDSTKLRNKTFRDPSVCKANLVWKCPTLIWHAAKKQSSLRPCRLDHDPYYQQQFQDAVQQYITARQRAEPDWNAEELHQGDPWGYMFENLESLEAEINAINNNRVQTHQRHEVFRHFDVDDPTYNALHKQIRDLYLRLDPLLDERDQEPPPEAVMIIQQLQQLEAELMKLFSSLVHAQVAVLLRYYERRRAFETELRSAGEEITQERVNERVPLPPCVIDIEKFTPFRFNSNPDLEFYNSLANLERNTMHAVGGFKMQVCETCGGLLNLHDEFRRFSDHVCGKAHLGCRDMRAQILHYTTTIKPFAHPHAEVKAHLIHPWHEWAQRFQPRSEFEMKLEQERLAGIRAQQNMLTFLKQFNHQYQDNPHSKPISTDSIPSSSSSLITMTDSIIKPNQTFSHTAQHSCELNHFDPFLIDPSICLAMDSLNPSLYLQAETIKNSHTDSQQQHNLHHQQQQQQQQQNPHRQKSYDYHVSEEDAFRGGTQPRHHHHHQRNYNNHPSGRDRDRSYHNHNRYQP